MEQFVIKIATEHCEAQLRPNIFKGLDDFNKHQFQVLSLSFTLRF